MTRLSGAALIAAVVIDLGLAATYGLGVSHAVLAVAVILAVQVLPGALVWRCVRPVGGWLLEDLVVGFAIGCALGVPAQVLAGSLQQAWLAAAVPLVIPVLLVAVPRTRQRIATRRITALPWWLGGVVALASAAALTQLATYFRRLPLSAAHPWSSLADNDAHLAIAAELQERGPQAWPSLTGVPLDYHWFSHAWAAQVATLSGAPLDEVLFRVLPSILPVIVAVGVAMSAVRLSGRPAAGAAAALLTMLVSNATPWALLGASLPLKPDSPTLGMSIPALLALVTVIGMRWQGSIGREGLLLVALLGVAAAGTKGSTTPLVVAGLMLAAVAMLVFDRSRLRLVLADLVVVVLALLVTVQVVFHGYTSALEIDPAGALKRSYAGAVAGVSGAALVYAVVTQAVSGVTRAALLLLVPTNRTLRREPLWWLLIGAVIAGVVAPMLFVQPGASQFYFLISSYPLAAVGSAVAGARLLPTWTRQQVWTTVLAGIGGGVVLYFLPAAVAHALTDDSKAFVWWAGGLAALLVLAYAVLARLATRRRGEGRPRVVLSLLLAVVLLAVGATAFGRWLPQSLGPPTQAATLKAPNAVSSGQIAAARYIERHSAVHDLVMTNRHCLVPQSPVGGCDSRRFVVSAYSKRQALLEGWGTSPTAARLAPHGEDSIFMAYWNPALLQLNDGFYARPTPTAAKRLWDKGVRWIYVENTMRHAATLAPYATLRYRNDDAAAWQLHPPRE